MMERYSTYHIETDGFEKILVGMFHMIQTVPLGVKCQVVLNYDPALPKTTIETFIHKSDMEQVREKPFQCPGRKHLATKEAVVMTPEEINIFAKEVYNQCIDRKMTCNEFNLFVHYITMHKEAVNSALRRQVEGLSIPILQDIV